MKHLHGRLLPVPARDLGVLVVAVVIGGIGGALANTVAHWGASADTARNLALATATTLTGATHAWLAHRQPLRMVVPGAAVSGPVVYLAMRLVHLLVAS